MKRLLILFALVCVIFTAVACGGGGSGTGSGGGQGAVVGRVLNIETGAPLNNPATVQVGSNTANTSPDDGSFLVQAPNGSTTLLVDTHGLFGVRTFSIPSVNGTVDAGDLWVGPEQVTLTGRVVSSTDLQPIAGATVSFGGRNGVTNAQGIFTLANVAYSSNTQTAFWGIVGSATATNFFKTDFSTAPSVANNGVVTISDVVLTPLSDPNPPPAPANIIGRVLPSDQAPGTIVTLRDSGGNVVRTLNVGPSGGYSFWVPPGNYTVSFQNGTLTATSQSVTLATTDQVVRVPDVTLHG